MVEIARSLLLLASIMASSIGFVIGMRRLTYWLRLDRHFIGDILVTFAWVLPEYLIALNALLSPDAFGAALVSVGAIMGSAAANMLVIGFLNSAWSDRECLETTGTPLASAAIVLLVSCVTVVGIGIGSGKGVSLAQILAGIFVYAVFLAGLRLVYRRNPKEKPRESDALHLPGRGSLHGALALTGFSVLALVYASPPFTELALSWFRWDDESSHAMNGFLSGSRTITLGLLMAIPDSFLAVLDLKEKGGETQVPRLFLTSAALIAFTAIAGMDYLTLGNGIAGSLFASFLLTVFAVALTVIMLLAAQAGLSARTRGLIVTALAIAGLVFSLFMIGR